MSDNLVQRLRDLAEEWFEMCEDIHEPLYEAADSIQAQAAEIERLREALEYYAQELMTGPWGIDSLDFGDVARAALEQST